jgi:hypothetical protein
MKVREIAINALSLNLGISIGLWVAARDNVMDVPPMTLVASNCLVGGAWLTRILWKRTRTTMRGPE